MDEPCNALTAVHRALLLVYNGGQYILGTGDYRADAFTDRPWTYREGKLGSDCAGFAICWCWKLRRHRPGFNRGPWATIEDDLNVNSIMEDAVHNQELATEVDPGLVAPGDLLCYPTFKVKGKRFIGHVGIVTDISPRYKSGRYQDLMVAHCHGPNFRSPAVTLNTGQTWVNHDKVWPKPQHRTHVIRMKERL